ncbi:hypothetical protein D3C75_627570 [compost metagenome]
MVVAEHHVGNGLQPLALGLHGQCAGELVALQVRHPVVGAVQGVDPGLCAIEQPVVGVARVIDAVPARSGLCCHAGAAAILGMLYALVLLDQLAGDGFLLDQFRVQAGNDSLGHAMACSCLAKRWTDVTDQSRGLSEIGELHRIQWQDTGGYMRCCRSAHPHTDAPDRRHGSWRLGGNALYLRCHQVIAAVHMGAGGGEPVLQLAGHPLAVVVDGRGRPLAKGARPFGIGMCLSRRMYRALLARSTCPFGFFGQPVGRVIQTDPTGHPRQCGHAMGTGLRLRPMQGRLDASGQLAPGGDHGGGGPGTHLERGRSHVHDLANGHALGPQNLLRAITGPVQDMRASRPRAFNLLTDHTSAAHTVAGGVQHRGKRSSQLCNLAWRRYLRTIDDSALCVACLGLKQQFGTASSHRDIAQSFLPRLCRQLFDELRCGRLRTRWHHLAQFVAHQLLHGGLLQQHAHFIGKHAIAATLLLAQALHAVLHVIQHLAGGLVGVHALLRVEGGQTIFLRETSRRFRMQACRIEGGSPCAGDGRRGGSHAATEGVTGDFEVVANAIIQLRGK